MIMAGAIIEISVMLLVSLGLGLFIAWQYWRKKYRENDDALMSIIHSKEETIVAQGKAEKKQNQRISDLEEEVKNLTEVNRDSEAQIASLTNENKKHQTTIQELKEELVSKQKALDELEKELDKEKKKKAASSKSTSSPKPKPKSKSNTKIKTMEDHSYYRTIDGKKYKDKPIQMAEEAVAGQGDGRISKADAEKIFATISDGHVYTDIEKNTMKYLRDNFRWTPEADELFRHEVRVWAAKGHKLD